LEGVDIYMNDGLNIIGTIDYALYDEHGELKDSGKISNRAQYAVKEELIDVLGNAAILGDITHMSIGSSTGQATTDTALASKSTHWTVSKSETSDFCLRCVSSFNNMAATTITEAGLFPQVPCTSNMYFYNDGLSISIGGTSDSLVITWTVCVL